MTLTQITQQKRNPENVNLFLDGEFWCSLSKNDLLEFKLHKDLKISEKRKEEIETASGINKIKEAIIKYVSYRPRSKKEIVDHMVLKKSFERDNVESVIQKLEIRNKQLIDDNSFAIWFAENRIHHGTHGSNKIRAELIKKGVDSKIINKVLNDLENRDEVKEMKSQQIKEYIEKLKVRYQKSKNLSEFELKQKLTQALARKGFSFDEISPFL